MSTAANPDALAGEAYDDLLGFATVLEDAFASKDLEIGIDEDALVAVAQSYAHDIHRYKDFHENAVPDVARKMAYLCKWIMRFRPIVVQNPTAKTDEKFRSFAIMANELLVVYCLVGKLRISWKTDLSPVMRHIFLYSLRYRASSEDTFILYLASLCKL